MQDQFTVHNLSNGLRVVVEVMPGVKSAAAGFFARTGGRDETPELAGVSHFLEHMCFKGTPRRGWREITVDFDNLGSTYNAYTSKDRTFYYGWVSGDKIEPQIELLADMMQSVLPENELEMERNVILEEVAMSNDHIENIAYDFLHEQVFPNHALSWPVLGYEHTVQQIQREQMLDYFATRYAPGNLMLIVAGAVDPQEIIGLAQKYCGPWNTGNVLPKRSKPIFKTGNSGKKLDPFTQQLLAWTYLGPGGKDASHETAEVMASILGGANSRFYWNIIQKGVCAKAGVWHVDYQDCGLLILSAQCDPEACEKVAEAIELEAQRITREGVSEDEVQRVKNRRRTTLALEGESPYYRINQLLDDMDYRGHPRTVQGRLAEVDAVTPRTIAEYLERYPITKNGHLFSVGPRDWRIRNGQ